MTAITLAVTAFFTITSSLTAVPAYGSPLREEDSEPPSTYQTLDTLDTVILATPPAPETFEVIVEPPPAPVTEEIPAPQVVAPVITGSGSAGLLGAARAQLGITQDCTAMVENALRALGYSVGDLAPMGFGGYGYQVSPDQAQPGDIMMRGGHVAIYAGNGVAVHGGFNGSTVETSIDGSPYNYAVIIRL